MKINHLRLTVMLSLCAAIGTCSTAYAKSYTLQIALKNGQTAQHAVADISHITFSGENSAKMIVTDGNATPGSTETSGISRISFDGDNMVISTGADNTTHSIPEIKHITFDLSTTGTENITADLSDDMTISMAGGMMTVDTADGAPVNITVYTISGQAIEAFSGNTGITIDLNSLSAGIYIVKVNNKTIKFTR